VGDLEDAVVAKERLVAHKEGSCHGEIHTARNIKGRGVWGGSERSRLRSYVV